MHHDFLERHRHFDEGEGVAFNDIVENRASGEAGGSFASIFGLPDDEELIVYTCAGGTPTRIVLEEDFIEEGYPPT